MRLWELNGKYNWAVYRTGEGWELRASDVQEDGERDDGRAAMSAATVMERRTRCGQTPRRGYK